MNLQGMTHGETLGETNLGYCSKKHLVCTWNRVFRTVHPTTATTSDEYYCSIPLNFAFRPPDGSVEHTIQGHFPYKY